MKISLISNVYLNDHEQGQLQESTVDNNVAVTGPLGSWYRAATADSNVWPLKLAATLLHSLTFCWSKLEQPMAELINTGGVLSCAETVKLINSIAKNAITPDLYFLLLPVASGKWILVVGLE